MKQFASSRLRAQMRKSFCIATIIAASSCTTAPEYREWTAQGWLTPSPSGEPEIIGVYAAKDECLAAADAWMSRQVVGNPVYANCLPVDPH
jgi:hypothetical protein